MISEERCLAQPQACGEVWRDIGWKNCTKDVAQTCCCSCESCEKTIHKGRHLIFRLRKVNGQVNTKSYAVLPLPPKVACKGSSAGAESFLEVAKGVTQKLKPGKHIASADGSPALQKAAGLATLPKKGMTQDYVTLQRKLVQDGMAKEKQDCFILAAGDHVAEGLANVSEGQLRRMGLLSTTARDKIEHRNLLCAHYLNKEPGLERVLRALAVHRQKASNGLTSPSQCFQKPLWNLWTQWKAQKRWLSAFGPLWRTQIVLVVAMNFNGSPFSLAFAGFCILILMTMYGPLTKSTNLPRNLLLPSSNNNTFC